MRKSSLVAGTVAVAAMAWLGCAREPDRAVAQPSAPRVMAPAERMGQTELQAPSTADDDDSSNATAETSTAESTPSLPPLPAPRPDAVVAVRPDGTTVTAGEIALSVGKVPVPPGSTLVARESVTEVQGLPEELESMSVDEIAADTVAVKGVDRTYDSPLSYRQAVRYFDRSLAKAGFTATRRETTSDATAWAVRCPGGERAHVAVRDTSPTTVEIVEANGVVTEPEASPRQTIAAPGSH